MRYSNIPPDAEPTSNSTVKEFDNYQSQTVELDTAVFNAMKGFFTNKGFGEVSAESITTTFMIQSKQDGYNPMQILDIMKGLNSLELSGLVAEILNYNRYKSSSLGYSQKFIPNQEVLRNIIDIPNFNEDILLDEAGNPLLEGSGQILTTDQ